MFALPDRKHLVHKAIEPAKLSAKVKASAIAAATWNEIKYDGCHSVLIKAAGKVHTFNRQAAPIDGAMNHVAWIMEKMEQDDFVWFAEAYRPDVEFSVVNGTFRKRHCGIETAEAEANADPSKYLPLYAVVFDQVPLADFMRGECNIPYLNRRNIYAQAVADLHEGPWGEHPFAKYITVSEGCSNKDDLSTILEQYRAGERLCFNGAFEPDQPLIFGTDGYIQRDPDAPWIAGAGADGFVLKDKDKLSVDLVITGLFEGQGKFAGMLGGVEATYKGQAQRIQGGCLTDKERAAMFADPSLIVGKVWEVHGLGESTNGLIREPRLARPRPDKTAADCD